MESREKIRNFGIVAEASLLFWVSRITKGRFSFIEDKCQATMDRLSGRLSGLADMVVRGKIDPKTQNKLGQQIFDVMQTRDSVKAL